MRAQGHGIHQANGVRHSATKYYDFTWDDATKRAIKSSRKIAAGEEEQMLSRFAQHYELPYRLAVQSDHQLFDKFGAHAIPYVVLVDRLGEIRMVRIGGMSNADREIEDMLEKLLAEEPAARPTGTLMMIGGAHRLSNAMLWSEFARLARGRRGRVAVFPTAYAAPAEMERTFVPHLRSLGLEPFVVPASPLLQEPDYRRIVVDPEWGARVRDADACHEPLIQ